MAKKYKELTDIITTLTAQLQNKNIELDKLKSSIREQQSVNKNQK